MKSYRADPQALAALVEPDRVHRDVYIDPEVFRLDFSRTPFIYTETRGDDSQRYAATAWHTLVRDGSGLRIRLKRVDILNADAALPSIQLFL
jgi:hypothetical protein